ncbi:aspartyl protease family [Plasmopara halstedii]|uniref:Aspartyl protease family n=1 Tax=Plasmopara halstedii TaxID=4781 RepID=A0A0P1AV10_PLAHL|nr:aspartyl protease family [Plasmopara halstedii]CEG44849.1 aspartyl protease family [Plasmopara halstedii]|eukprot:XP_024581218.1 aspartyl protease family [Plasmopara halstedii]
MNVAESKSYHMRIDSIRKELSDVDEQLQATQDDITKVVNTAEEFTTEARALACRREELEKDEAALVQSEALAVRNKVLAEKKLMEVGGYECIVRILRKALQKAKLELMDTQDETKEIIREELMLRSQIDSMTQSLATARQSVAQLQKDCAVAAESKRDTDDKLRQLSQFLNQALNSPPSNLRPSSPTFSEP